MFDDVAAYFYENVVASYTSYRDIMEDRVYGRSRDLRASIIAASALFHFREHLPAAHKLTRTQVEAMCPDYGILGDIVNAAKHSTLDRGSPKIVSASDVREVTVITMYEDDEGSYSDVAKQVVAKQIAGKEHVVIDLLTNVINFWGNCLVNWNIVSSYKPFVIPSQPGTQLISRSDARGMDTEILRGVRFKQCMKLQKYDPAIGSAQPFDLTGAKLEYRVYKPSYCIDVLLRNAANGRETKVTLDLSEPESVKWHGLKTDEQRQQFMAEIADRRKDEIEKLLIEAVSEEDDKSGDPPQVAT